MRDHVATRLRDGALQDLLAVSMLLTAARERLAEADTQTAAELLDEAHATVRDDLVRLRMAIGDLNQSAPATGRTLERQAG